MTHSSYNSFDPKPAEPVLPEPAFPARVGLFLVPASLVILTIACLSAYGDLQQVFQTLGTFELRGCCWALALATLSFCLRAVRFQCYLADVGVHIPHREGVLVFFSGLSMALTPGRIGELIKPLMLNRSRDIPLSRVLPVLALERATDLIALLLLSAWGALILPGGRLIAAACLLTALAACLVFISPWPALRLRQLARRLPYLRDRAPRFDAIFGCLALVSQPRTVVTGVSFAVLAWSCQVLGLQQIVHGLPHADITIQASAFASCAPLIAGAVALVPGGVGVAEATMTGALQSLDSVGFTSASAVVVTLLVRLTTFWFSILLGGLALLWHGGLSRLRDRPCPSKVGHGA